ncbi:hypothetical protein ACFWBC_10170 [Streptomyces sp. NPDC059985]|uniref:hypothetical protein n=1 Tax=Streptomyces sp. NPDC059985 TaxID=3347025 RepID=UPI0036A4C502
MKTIDGRRWATRPDLVAHSGYSRDTLAKLWAAREANDHPAARTVDRVMHWDLEVWTQWFEQHRQAEGAKPQAEPAVDRTGDPNEELAPAAQARLLGVDPSRITQYDKKPPPGWPEGRVEQLPTRTRRWRTRRQLWDFVDANPSFGTAGGRPAGPAAEKKPDPRIQLAAQALAAHPERKPGEVAADLAREHGQSIDTWKRIVTEARRSR